MKTMAISKFKSHALQVIGDVAESKERVIVTKRGKPLAEVIPFTEPQPVPGQLSETLVFEEDIVSPLGENLWNVNQ